MAVIDKLRLQRLSTDLQGVLEVIDLDMSGVDPGIGRVVPIDLSHQELLSMVNRVLYDDRPIHSDADYDKLEANYAALRARIEKAVSELGLDTNHALGA